MFYTSISRTISHLSFHIGNYEPNLAYVLVEKVCFAVALRKIHVPVSAVTLGRQAELFAHILVLTSSSNCELVNPSCTVNLNFWYVFIMLFLLAF